FTVRIEIKGLLTSSFNFFKVFAYALPSFFLTAINVGVILNKTASRIEHKNENPIETEAYINSRVISNKISC
ncbi:MAG: hypothetical protein KAH72_00585, partial [Flavobacteriaceae bacterium]|nr:hypothetical protein [Flavobacteriaceae bacterium]